MEINKYSSTPLYSQIAQIIKDKIDSGEYRKNQILPSEMDIQKQYDISRITVRKAYDVLMKQGIIRAVRGKGTFVNDLDVKNWTWMHHFTSDVKRQGREPSTKILSFREMNCDPQIAKMLEIEPNCQVYYLKRLRLIDNIPIWLTRSYIPVNMAEGLEKEYFSEKGSAQSLFFILEHDFNIAFGTGQDVEYLSDVPSKDLAFLNLAEDAKVEKVGFVGRDEKGQPLVYEKTIYEKSLDSK